MIHKRFKFSVTALAALISLLVTLGFAPVKASAATLDPNVCSSTVNDQANGSALVLNDNTGLPIGADQGQVINQDEYQPGQPSNNITLPFRLAGYYSNLQIDPNGRLYIGDGAWGDASVPTTGLWETTLDLFHTDLNSTVQGAISYGSCVVNFNGSAYDAYSVTWQDVAYQNSSSTVTMQIMFVDLGNAHMAIIRNYVSLPDPLNNVLGQNSVLDLVSGFDADPSNFMANYPNFDVSQPASVILDGSIFPLTLNHGPKTQQVGRYVYNDSPIPLSYCDSQASTNLQVTYSAPSVEAVDPSFTNMRTENFDVFGNDGLPNGYQDAIGTWTGNVSTHVADLFWGAGGVGAGAAVGDGSLTAPTGTCYKYLGFLWSAGSPDNNIDLLDENGNLLANFTASDLFQALKLNPGAGSPCPDANNPYCGRTGSVNPVDPTANDSNEPWAYVNLRFPAGFKTIRFYGTGFEFDNVSTSEQVPPVLASESSTSQPIQTSSVTYDSNDGTLNTETDTKVLSGALSQALPSGWERAGYRFRGWSVDPNATVPDSSVDPSAGSTFYAVWSQAYSVTYDGNGATSGDAPTDSQTYLTNDTVTASANGATLVRDGYTLTGWNTAANGMGTPVDLGGSVLVDGSDLVLYAMWSQDQYTVTYDANDGTSTTATATYTFGDNTALTDFTNPFNFADHTFRGWALTSDASDPINSYLVTGDVTLYAVWQATPPPVVNPLAPGQPGKPVVTVGDGTAVLTWSAPTTGGTVTSYSVTSSPSGVTCSVVGLTAQCGGLTNGTSYLFIVTASNADGSTQSVVSDSATPQAVVIDDPTATSVNESASFKGTSGSFTFPGGSGFNIDKKGVIYVKISSIYLNLISGTITVNYKSGSTQKVFKCSVKEYGSKKKLKVKPTKRTTRVDPKGCKLPAAAFSQLKTDVITIKAVMNVKRYFALTGGTVSPTGAILKPVKRILFLTVGAKGKVTQHTQH